MTSSPQIDENIESEAIQVKQNKINKNWFIFLFSSTIHSIIIVSLICVIYANSDKSPEDIIVTSQLIPEPEIIEENIKRDVIKHQADVTVTENEVAEPMITEQENSDHIETTNVNEESSSEGREESISDKPLIGSSLMGNIGGGGGGGGTFGSRIGGGKKMAVLKGGGSHKTEASVDAALRWLMRHQEKEGYWDRDKFGNDKNNSGFNRNGLEGHTALTGLSVLAFLSAGHTSKIGKYKNVVHNALNWLLLQQKEDGSFGNSKAYSVYDNAICALALAEAAGMSADSRVRNAAQKSLDFLFTYNETKKFHKVIDGKPNSVSVAGWLLMAFKSGKLAGLTVPEEVFQKYKERLDEVTEFDSSGMPIRTYYMKKGDRNDKNTTMTCVGMLVYEYLGLNRAELSKMADLILKDLPKWGKDSMNQDMYHWYYATLALFQFGGEHWKKWNSVMSKMLIEKQNKGGPLDGSLNDIDGSWDPDDDYWGKSVGRTYMTAMGAFCLEIYYRYESVLK